MKKNYLTIMALLASTLLSAQAFWTATTYKGAFPITDNTPATDWTSGWTNWDPENANYGTPTTIISANIATSTTLSGIVQLVGNISVTNNSTLTILPGTVVRGDKATKSCLIITRGAKIMAEGTANNPIVFTSNESIANGRAPGDWGGLVILGNGVINTACATCTASAFRENYIEGFATNFPEILYGGTNNADNSGILSYVRIEFSGVALSSTPNSELNGLTMGGVGSGTKIDHVQCSFIGDDAFEWFGGAVDAKYLVSFRNLDDDFDTDFGHQGRVQFGLIIRDKDISDAAGDSNGFESDNFNPGIGRLPLTKTIFSNITSIGPKRDGSVALPGTEKFERAIFQRRNTAISIHNSIFTGWEKGLEINGSTTADNYFSSPDTASNAGLIISDDIPRSFTGQTYSTMVNYAAARDIDTTKTFAQIAFVNGLPANLENTPDYRLTASSVAGAGASFTNSIFGGQFVNLANLSKEEFEVINLYPNPSKESTTLFISAKNSNRLDVAVYDITGKIVATPVVNSTISLGNNNFTINTSELNNGIYFVTLKTSYGKETVKLVVQH